MGADIADAVTGSNLLLYAGAVVTTGAMAFGGADHSLRVGVQRSIAAPAYADSAYYAGYVLPAAIAPALYLIGLVAQHRTTAGAGSAALQAVAWTLVATSILKIGTGRPYPLHGGDPNAPDRLDHPEYAREFRPFQTAFPVPAWPSGHTSAITSVVGALTAYYPDQIWIPLVGYPVALAIGFGLVVGDRHWVSDVVSGGLLGHTIGHSVGSSFRRRMRGDRAGDHRTGLQVVPILGSTYCGVAVGEAF
jgi:membrane-associated phospholipid phosphatase